MMESSVINAQAYTVRHGQRLFPKLQVCFSKANTRARTTHAAPITPHRASSTPSFARVSCPCLASSIRRMSEESSKAEVNAKTECERPGTRDRALMQVCLSNEHDSAAAG